MVGNVRDPKARTIQSRRRIDRVHPGTARTK